MTYVHPEWGCFVPDPEASLSDCPDCGAVIDDIDLAVSLACGNVHHCPQCGSSFIEPRELDERFNHWPDYERSESRKEKDPS